MERTNARYLAPEMFPEPLRLATIDVAFISLKLILPALLPCLADGAGVVALVKPQFEAEPRLVKKGVVRDAAVHAGVLNDILEWLRGQPVSVRGLSWSPITGPKGNIEFLLYMEKSEAAWDAPDVGAVVQRAHQCAGKDPAAEC
jgi:23S rRNA (cytidine1920-2'-O)/16S rRNA (cytidine1409-2'-O)-methyltransferase